MNGKLDMGIFTASVARGVLVEERKDSENKSEMILEREPGRQESDAEGMRWASGHLIYPSVSQSVSGCVMQSLDE